MIPDIKKWCTPIEHTADCGAAIWGESPQDLFEHAAMALADLLSGDSPVSPSVENQIEVHGLDYADLLVNWLREVLFLYGGQGHLIASAAIHEMDETHLSATVMTEPYCPKRHEIFQEIKAVTYHGLQVEHTPEGWKGAVIFDV